MPVVNIVHILIYELNNESEPTLLYSGAQWKGPSNEHNQLIN